MTDTSSASAAQLTVAVVGATGQQGGATARALIDQGAQVVALTRNTDSPSAQALASAGAELGVLDLDQLDSVRSAFEGADRVFAMATMTEGETEQGQTMAQAAKDAGLSRLVYSSVGGAERHSGVPHFESKRRIEERIIELGLPASFVRPVFFMENLPSQAGVEDGQVVLRMPFPDDIPLQLIAVEDIGRAAAALLMQDGAVPEAIEIGGDELTGSQMAAVFGRFAGLPARYEAVPVSVLGDNEDMVAMFTWFAETEAYQADFAGTKALVPSVMGLDAWLPTSGWSAS